MKNRLKYPLSLFVVWHPAFAVGKQIANDLYSTFCRNIEEPLSRGLGVQVYYRSASLIPIDKNIANRNAIILLVDENFMTDGGFQEYTKQLVGLMDDNTRIYPIALCKQATGIGCGLDSIQFIRHHDGFINIQDEYKKEIKKIKSELLHDCARLLMNFQPVWMDKKGSKIPSPVKLFLSHAKKDGEKTAKKFKVFVESETKLDIFFDTVDIADGYEFEKQIGANIENAALVVFHTDEYSSREWCRIEVLVAKRYKCSIVVVHDIKDGEKRAFPYMGNTPTITLKQEENSSFNEILTLTLYQVVNNLYQRELLKSFEEKFKDDKAEFVTITSPPELFNYIDLYKKKRTVNKKLIVLYPEPPLGAEELRILNDIDKDIKFITPIYLPTL
ncbi:protein containing TIR domain [Lentimicrobium saccharophilum]|uniref:Protein containing TIR domain n=1 Tax=Lentimicrobium saccharophilum TaxID=1678841 RepID=A0A0S7C058_9BACT|nr:TIR domain-containing protein [Lentimicrobium saccharophilum]GAP44251.1 protein containing TIR domain [Lentimicrobium saccharophilum]